jgi:carbonic anhydrase
MSRNVPSSNAENNASPTRRAAAQVLKVKHVLVCGHDNCGAVKAALTMPSTSSTLTNCWISQIRDVRNANVDDLAGLDLASQISRLGQLNVAKQVRLQLS